MGQRATHNMVSSVSIAQHNLDRGESMLRILAAYVWLAAAGVWIYLRKVVGDAATLYDMEIGWEAENTANIAVIGVLVSLTLALAVSTGLIKTMWGLRATAFVGVLAVCYLSACVGTIVSSFGKALSGS
jgi:hypothetical protein